MRYTELTAAVAPADAERAGEVLRAIAGGGISIEAPFLQRSIELGAEPRTDALAFVRAYINDGDVRTDVLEMAGVALSRAAISADISQRTVREEDWAESWKEHFHVERFGKIVVVPSWREYTPRAQDVVITLDPGMAFGTGQHETTRMCLEALSRHVRAGMRVLDAGCGSGIVAIAAAKLGASEVLAADIDAECVRITNENAATNGIDDVVRARQVEPDDAPAFAIAVSGGFEIIVANIVPSTIIDLANAFAGSLVADGRLIASGIIGDRERETCAALESVGLQIETVRAMGEWRCIEARPKPDAVR